MNAEEEKEWKNNNYAVIIMTFRMERAEMDKAIVYIISK
jgi:hypothetical protein